MSSVQTPSANPDEWHCVGRQDLGIDHASEDDTDGKISFDVSSIGYGDHINIYVENDTVSGTVTDRPVHKTGRRATIPIDDRRRLQLTYGDEITVWVQHTDPTVSPTNRPDEQTTLYDDEKDRSQTQEPPIELKEVGKETPIEGKEIPTQQGSNSDPPTPDPSETEQNEDIGKNALPEKPPKAVMFFDQSGVYHLLSSWGDHTICGKKLHENDDGYNIGDVPESNLISPCDDCARMDPRDQSVEDLTQLIADAVGFSRGDSEHFTKRELQLLLHHLTREE